MLPAVNNLLMAPNPLTGATEKNIPAHLTPMLASLADGPFENSDWIYEPKLDGIRAIATIKNGSVELHSRRGLRLTHQYPELVEELSACKHNMVLDGEIVAFDEHGRPSFHSLQQRSGLSQPREVGHARIHNPVCYYVFDIIHLDQYSLLSVALEDRKAILSKTLVHSTHVRKVDPLRATGFDAYAASVQVGLEGVMAKHLGSTYQPGKRSRQWLKIKSVKTEDFVIAGYTEGTGARAASFGALLLGYYDQHGNLVYAGGCGTGFDEEMLKELHHRFKKLKTARSPFKHHIPGKHLHWLEPELVAEVKFAEWTHDGMLRAPVFVRLRQDKAPTQCTQADMNGAIDKQQVVDLSHARKRRQERNKQQLPPHESLIEQLKNAPAKSVIQVDGHELALTNLDKILWPAFGDHKGITKRDYLIYLLGVSPWLLPHCKDRPITFLRYPNGIKGGKFYQKHWEKGLPDFVQTTDLYTEHAHKDEQYVVCNNLPTLLWLAQIADLELHTWQSRIVAGPDGFALPTRFTGSTANIEASLLNYPDYLLFDLDPYRYSGKESKGAEP
jgi:bifunctional non-homologous end joining protein LigD